MEKEKINRINELARKAKLTTLSESEKAEQERLRNDYRRMFRDNLASTLKNTYILKENGEKEKLIKEGNKNDE